MIAVILLAIPFSALWELKMQKANRQEDHQAKYVGREACIECHEAEYNDWKGSDHDLAMDYANDSTVLGDFNNATLQAAGHTHKFYKKKGRYYVFTEGPGGKMTEFEVKYVFGHYPLQDYLVEFPGGRLQTLALTWNSKDGNWYYMPDSVYKGMKVDHTNWLHWTHQAQNWNSMCADCHSTHVQKNYDIKTDSYHTSWSEIDVSCEACHGPASEHLKWARLPDYARQEIPNAGLPIKTSGIDNHAYVDNCARCHSRRSIMGDFDPHSTSIYNHIVPALPTEPNWYIDGQIKEEDYVYASFTQSRMSMNDVKCNDCHNVHSGKLVLEGNKLCLQCHKANDYDTPRHTFHKSYGEEGEPVISQAGIKFEVGSGSQCINCHMHGQNYMGVDYRRDHSFRIPRPDLSEINGTPNACNQCHADKSNQWAQSYIEKWYGKSRPYQYGQAFFAAVNGQKGADKQLRTILNDDLYTVNIRSISLGYLSNTRQNDSLIRKYLNSMEPALRIEAVRALTIDDAHDLESILPLLYDDTRAVRMEVMNRLNIVDTNVIPAKYRKVFREVEKEQLQVLKYNADFPVGKFNLANYYYRHGDYAKAEKFYLQAIETDNELSIAKMNLAHLYSAIGQPAKAEKLLENYVARHPGDGNALYDYGLILSENRKYQKSLEYLLKASDLLPENGRVDYNISMLYKFFGDMEKSREYLRRSEEKSRR